ncbi:MAG: ADP-ribosylglycohydrolase family protein [Chitinophagaceae bacterium]|nr:ADP-ribosylglycohydrolase family protein [Chitinophagaceae bacterium]
MKKSALSIVVIIGMTCTVIAQSPNKMLTISKQSLKDKIAGGWAGKMIGVTYGAPTEFNYLQRINNDSIKWTPADIKGSVWQDDIYVQLTFLMAMDKYGMEAPAVKYQEMLAKAGYHLWCANMQARKNYFDGIYPPMSGNPAYNYRADDIDFQIEADYIGFMNPGMIQNIINECDKIGHIMNYGDGIYGGIFLSALYSAAFFEKDINKIIETGLSSIPAESDYAKIVRDVMKLHRHYPTDWKAAWQELDAKWGDVDISGAGSVFNIDAKLNGAFIVMGLLYGDLDDYKTLEITTRCGADSDCNPSNALAVIGVIKGFSNLPPEMQKGVKDVGDSVFINTTYSFNTAVEATYNYALKLILQNGGKVKGDSIIWPVQQFTPAKFESSFPAVVFDNKVSVFSTGKWNFNGNWNVFKVKSWDGKTETEQAMVSKSKGDELELEFNGTGISLMGNWVKDGGKADIYLDGKFHRSIDTYYNYSKQEHRNISLWHVFQLKPGKHSVKVFVKGEKNKESLDSNIYITEAIIYKTEAKKSDLYKFSFAK